VLHFPTKKKKKHLLKINFKEKIPDIFSKLLSKASENLGSFSMFLFFSPDKKYRSP
jgi:hypothetical protein